jgi:hypothetical protein
MITGWADRYLDAINRWNVFLPGFPPQSSPDDIAIAFEPPPDLLELKVEAMRAHESQSAPMFEELGEDFVREAHGPEWFRLAARG